MQSFRAMPPRKVKPGAAALESSEGIAGRLEEMERKIERLRAVYESFFLGSERRPPHVPRQELNRLMLETQQISIRNAGLRFRFQTLSQRWTLLTTYWNRTLREIESGTYRRDLQKAYRRIAARGQPLTESEAAALGIPAARAQAFVAQQNRRWVAPAEANSGASSVAPTAPGGPNVAAETPVPAAPVRSTLTPTTVAAPPTGTDPTDAGRAPRGPDADVDLTAIHRAYAEAHLRLGLPGAPPTASRLRAKVLPQLERLRAGHPGARVDVAVVSDNGRIVIRAKRA